MAAAFVDAATASSYPITPLKPFELPDHVHACRMPEGIIFLDTRNDRYFGLSGKQANAIASMVEDWPARSAASTDNSISPDELHAMAQALLERGLLTRRSSSSTHHPTATIPPVEMISPGSPTDTCRNARLLDVANFVMASLRAAWVLKWKTLESIELEMRSFREDHPPNKSDRNGTAAELAQVFRGLRRFFYSDKERCLFNALSLMYFLRRYGHCPSWVIGVNTAPFGAHSWVQEGQTALDGDPTFIRRFVPILVA